MASLLGLFLGLAVLLPVVVPTTAEAIPAFSRMYGQSCSFCHSVYPKLNQAGEEFRLSGYTRLEGGAATPTVPPVTAGPLSLPGIVPISVIGTIGWDARRVSERNRETGAKRRTDANSFNLEEIEIMAAAPLGKHLSFILDFPLAETEFEDRRFRLEGPEAPELAALSFNNLLVDDLLNVRLGAYELPLGISPRQRRVSIAPYEIFSAGASRLLHLEGATQTGIAREGEIFDLAKSQLLAEVYGSAYPEHLGLPGLVLRYHVGTANDSNRNGDNNGSKSLFGRVSLTYREHTLGFFGFWSPNVLDRDLPAGFPGRSSAATRFGPDLQLRFFNEALSLSLQYLWGRDEDPTGTGTAFRFSGGFLEALYAIKLGKAGLLAPLVRFDYVQGQRFDNTEGATALGVAAIRAKPRVWALTGGLQYLPWENVKLMAEVTYRRTEDRLSSAESTLERDRISEILFGLQAMLAF